MTQQHPRTALTNTPENLFANLLIPCNPTFLATLKESLCVMPVSYTYEREQEVWVTLNRPEVDRDSISQSIPNFTDATAREFQRTVVEQLTPDCIKTNGITICPSDRG